MGSRRSGATGGGRSCVCGPGPRSRRWSWNARRWRHRASRNRNTRAHPSAGCALPFVRRGWGAGCGHGRRRRAADRAGARNAASAGVRSCGRTATSTARPGSREVWQAPPPEPRHGTPASSSRPPKPAPPSSDECSPRAAARSSAPGSASAGEPDPTGPPTTAQPCAAGRLPCAGTRSCCACPAPRRLPKEASPAAPLRPARKARSLPCGALPASPPRPPSACSGWRRAATSVNPPGNETPAPPGAALHSAPPPAPVPARTVTARCAPRTPAPHRRATGYHRHPPPASAPPPNPRHESPSDRRYRRAGSVTSPSHDRSARASPASFPQSPGRRTVTNPLTSTTEIRRLHPDTNVLT